MRVLVADDEERYRTYLRASLAEHGHEVSTVDTGRNAIDQGVRFRPNVLVADWMLTNGIHGLRVAEVLRAVDPRVQTILITAFASTDLKEDARSVGVYQFLEKPFELEAMVDAVEQAWSEPGSEAESDPLCALIEVDSAGLIVYANDAARDLFLEAGSGRDVVRLEELFGDRAITYLVESNERWLEVQPTGRETINWWIRSKTWPDGGVMVLVPDSRPSLKDHELVGLLLETGAERAPEWPFDDHVLLIDDAKKSRALCARLLEQAGCVCFKAESQELAIRLFRADPKIGVVITDYEMPGADIDLLISELRTIRPEAKIVGSSKKGMRNAFAALGVERYLEKGWRIADLIEVLED